MIFEVSSATYRNAVTPARIILRQGARVVHDTSQRH